jgi:hypothetical protein
MMTKNSPQQKKSKKKEYQPPEIVYNPEDVTQLLESWMEEQGVSVQELREESIRLSRNKKDLQIRPVGFVICELPRHNPL